jgi:hypothetical protein
MAGKNSGSKASNDLRSRQLNQEHANYWKSRGESGPPANGGATTPPDTGGGNKQG